MTATTAVQDAAFSSDGTLLAVNEWKRIRLWQIATRRPLRTFEHPAYFEHFAFLDEGRQILSVHKDGFMRIWDTATGALVSEHAIPGYDPGTSILVFHYEAGHGIAVMAEVTGRVLLWSRASRKIVYQSTPRIDSLDDANLSSDGRRLIVLGRRTVLAIDWARKSEQRYAAAEARGVLVLAGDRVLRKTSDTDCASDLFVADYRSGGGPDRLDPAPGCRPAPAGEADEISGQLSVLPEAGGKAFLVTRTGRAGIELFDMAGKRPERTVDRLGEHRGNLIAADLAVGLAASLDGDRITIIGHRRWTDRDDAAQLRAGAPADLRGVRPKKPSAQHLRRRAPSSGVLAAGGGHAVGRHPPRDRRPEAC